MAEESSAGGQLRAAWDRVPGPAQIGIMIAVVAVFVWLVWGAVASMMRSWEPLATGLQGAEQARILEYLRSNQIEYKIEVGVIMVPSERAQELKIELAGQELQVGLLEGLERLESVGMGDTETTISARRQLALQEQIQFALNALPTVQFSQVHLAIPPDRGFLATAQEPAKASVWLTLQPNTTLTPAQVRGLQVQISHSIQNLHPDNVSILDHHSNLLSRKHDGDAQLAEIQLSEEARIRDAVLNLMEPKVGPNRVRVSATVELNRVSTRETRKDVDPSRAAEVSSTTIEEESTSGAGAGGEPGTATNTGEGSGAAAGGGAGGSRSRTEERRQTEFATTLTETERKPGDILRKSVAVVIDQRPVEGEEGTAYESWGDEALREWQMAIRDAIGISEQRGDSLTFNEDSFDSLHRIERDMRQQQVAVEQKRLYDIFDWSDWTMFIKIPLLILIVLSLVWFIIRPVGKRLAATLQQLPGRAPTPIPDQLPKTVEELEAEIEGRLEEELEIPTREVKKGTILKRRLTELAKSEPESVAQLIRTWLYE